MKTRITKQGMRNGAIAITLSLFGFAANAQQKTADIVKQATAKQGDIGTGLNDGGAIRVIDNKGTIKYLQVQNGLTQVTSTAPSGGIITTWQLGGKLTDNTEFDFNTKTLSFQTMSFNADATGAATTANPGANIAAVDQAATTGFTLLVRDEKTGNVLKMLASDLVKGGQHNGTATAGSDLTFTDPTVPADVSKVWVYRNGVKLLGGLDYSVAGTTGVATVTVKNASGTDPEDYAFITGDRIEIQWVK